MNLKPQSWILPLLAIVLSACGYIYLGYGLDRTAFPLFITVFFSLFLIFLYGVKNYNNRISGLLTVGVIFRILLVVALPGLSQDFYRFLWDGSLVLKGINPYLFTPDQLLESLKSSWPLAEELHRGMGSLSASNYSNYPPVNQVFFTLAAALGGNTLWGGVMSLKAVIIAADLGVVLIGKRILRHLNKPQWPVMLYFLNPFIIVELTGNLHFEGVMMFFFILSLWLLLKNKGWAAGLFLGLAIGVKLIPLIFLPLLFMYFTRGRIFGSEEGIKRGWTFALTAILTTGIIFLPLIYGRSLDNFTASVGLWFSKFEFNASIYYLVRQVGYWYKGYNIIGSIAPWIPVITAAAIGSLAFFKKNYPFEKLMESLLWGITVYLLCSTTVHPWYLTTPLLISVFTNYRYTLAWSALVMLSYYAYSQPGYTESAYLLWVEYGTLTVFLLKELITKKKLLRAFSG